MRKSQDLITLNFFKKTKIFFDIIKLFFLL